MTQLEALNLKDVKVYGRFGNQEWNGISDNVEKEGVIPVGAMSDKNHYYILSFRIDLKVLLEMHLKTAQIYQAL